MVKILYYSVQEMTFVGTAKIDVSSQQLDLQFLIIHRSRSTSVLAHNSVGGPHSTCFLFKSIKVLRQV